MAIKKVLVVDDSPTERHNLSEILTSSGFEVVTASDGAEGVKKAESEMPDLILMDVVMPGVSGFQATRSITKNEKTAHIPVMMCTSRSQETDRTWGLKQGATKYLVKPIEKNVLLAEIAKLGN